MKRLVLRVRKTWSEASFTYRRLWVGMLVVMVVVVEFPRALQKCIFDEVQSQATVVRAAPTAGAQAGQPPHHSGRRAPPAPLYGLSVTRRKRHRDVAPPTTPPPQPIRIRSWISRESDKLSEAGKERLEAAVEEALRMVSSLLSVNRVLGPLLLSRDINKYCKFLWRNSTSANYNRCGRANNNYRAETCLDVTIPDDHLAGCDIYAEADSPRRTELRPEGAGLPDTDFLMYLHIQATDKCRAEPKVLAYAVHCQTDARGRPVAGVVVVCRDGLAGATYSHQATVQTVIHELFHALGFSKGLFHTWRDCSSTSPGGSGCSPRGRVTHPDGSGQMRIYTPSIISALQEHLASADPELGGPLENQDVPPGRVSSHWESRVLQGSIMAAALGATVRIDPVTLAALQDTGWYTVDLSRAQSLVWGDGEGATFGSLSTCQDEASSFFCAGSGFGCHYLHLHKAECQTDPYLEGCRVYKPLESRSECWKEENSRRPSEEDWRGEIFGSDSRCFFSNLTRQNQSEFPSSSLSVEGRCYRHRCTGPNSFQIQASGSEWVDCPAGGAIQIKGYHGSVSCPDRRLCLHTDVALPSHDVSALPAPAMSGPFDTLTSAQNGSWSPLRPPTALTVAAALGITAAVCLLAAVVVPHKKCFPRGVRIHAAPEDHTDL